MNKRPSVIIDVKGGVIQQIRCTDPDQVGAILVDWDAIECGDLPMEYGLEPLNGNDSLLFLGMEGDREMLADWLALEGHAYRLVVCEFCREVRDTKDDPSHICLEMMKGGRK